MKISCHSHDKSKVKQIGGSFSKYQSFGLWWHHLPAVLVITAIGTASFILMKNFEIFSIVRFYVQWNDTNEKSLHHNEFHMEEVQITAAQTEISENIQSILNGQTRNDVEFQRQESLKHLSCSDRQIGSCGKVDKRHNLSLQEFLDVYDGKW